MKKIFWLKFLCLLLFVTDAASNQIQRTTIRVGIFPFEPMNFMDENDVAQLLADTASGSYTPKSRAIGNADFQFTRGLLGVSM